MPSSKNGVFTLRLSRRGGSSLSLVLHIAAVVIKLTRGDISLRFGRRRGSSLSLVFDIAAVVIRLTKDEITLRFGRYLSAARENRVDEGQGLFFDMDDVGSGSGVSGGGDRGSIGIDCEGQNGDEDRH